jgi:hypothetical protein
MLQHGFSLSKNKNKNKKIKQRKQTTKNKKHSGFYSVRPSNLLAANMSKQPQPVE